MFPIIPAVCFHRKVPWLCSQRFPTTFPMQQNKKNHVGGDLCPHIQIYWTYSTNFYWNRNSENFGTHLCNLCHKGIRQTSSQIDGVVAVVLFFFCFVFFCNLFHISVSMQREYFLMLNKAANVCFWCYWLICSGTWMMWGTPALRPVVSASSVRHCYVKTNRSALSQI